jgi:signal transduction histidine kinase
MASRRLRLPPAAGAVPTWRAPKILLLTAFNSSAWLGHDLINRFRAERYEVFLAAHLGAWASAGVVLPLLEYALWYRTLYVLLFAAVGVPQCIALAFGLRLARLGRYSQSISLVCVTNWISVVLVTLINPNFLAMMALLALVPVVFAEPYIHWKRGLVFSVITAAVVLLMTMLVRFLPIPEAVQNGPYWLETLVLVVGVPFNALHIMVIAWNNAAALRTSESQLAERADELAASRSRLTTAADEERRRLERDLHDGAQQHLVALSVILGLARNADHDKYQALLTEASELVDTSIVEIRRLAHGIYPPLLVSGGLTEALPTLAARATVPVTLDVHGLDRYPTSTEAALYYCCSEALTNAAKHGGPDTQVTVTANADDTVLRLVIADTGTGFDPATIGHGLINMADRLSAIGGTLAIDTAPGRGTRITATVDPRA